MSDPVPGPGYTPIACALHDELQLVTLRGARIALTYREPAGRAVSREARLVDVYTRAGAEYALLDDGTEIRLDRLVEVDGTPFLTDA